MSTTSLEIRLHGRGGQGGVTCAKILAAIYADLGKSVQSFGDYAGERSGAPVRAYTRVGESAIENRNKVYAPDHLVVLDPTLLGEEVLQGLPDGGTLLLNTPETAAALGPRCARFRVATIDATAIARRHRLGTRSVVIVNTTIAGAFARALDLPFAALEEAYRHLGLLSNLAAAKEAFAAVVIREPTDLSVEGRPIAAAPPQLPEVLALIDQSEGPAPKLRTGNWRTQTPRYVEHLAPCDAFCPAGNDVRGFVQALARGSVDEAAAILWATTPLPGVCGRVCPAPCMEGCNRREYDGAVNIRALERWIADHARRETAEVACLADAKRFAVVGGGPAGLAAAYTLRRQGHRVTIFDGEARLGGVLRTGIPAYRLPREVLDREIDAILGLGVGCRLGVRLDGSAVAKLATEHDGVILATGLQALRGAAVPGEELPGVEQGIDFLQRVNRGGGVTLGGHVVVLGGGNTAMDCARSARRAGAARVTIAYRRGRGEMPAIPEEIEEAEHEGVELLLLRAPVAFLGDGRVTAVRLAEVALGEPDASGRRRPVVTERTTTLPCDHVLLALGQSPDLSLLPAGCTVENGRLHQGGLGLPIFVAGDVGTGEGTVTHALGDGRRVALLALAALGLPVTPFVRPDRRRAVPLTDIRLDHFATSPPAREELLGERGAVGDLREVSRGLGSALEAHRCFSCGDCTRCDTCLIYCPEGIIRRKDRGYEVDYSYCKGCGICVVECPRSAIEMRQE